MIINVAAYPTDMFDIIGIWVGLLMLIFCYSYPLWKENPLYRFAEHTYVALTMAIVIGVNLESLNTTAVFPLTTNGQFMLIIPIILGFMMYLLLVPKYRWGSRYPVAILVGSSLGLGMAGVMLPNIVSQIISTITPPKAGASALNWFNFVYIAFGLICATTYFLLTYEYTGPVKQVNRLGRYFIMIALGAYFGNTVLFRFSMLASRAQYLLQVLKIIPM
jgi:hypothetical protein